MKNPWGVVMGVLFGLLGSAVVVLTSSMPRGAPIQLRPAPTLAPIRIHVTGAVRHPGVYDLAVDSRIEDAITISGGFTENADQGSINLAAQLQDGAQVVVPTQRASAVSSSSTAPQTPQSETQTTETTFPINLNTATQEEFELLPGIGPVTAEKIIDYRQTHGNFTSIEDIQKVSGIGPATFEKIQELITIGE